MSFSAEIKEEIMKIEDMPECCAHAMAYGMLLFGRSFDLNDISLLTDNPAVARTYAYIVGKVCGVTVDRQVSEAGKVTCEIKSKEGRLKVLDCFSTTGRERVKRIDRGNLLNESGDTAENIN